VSAKRGNDANVVYIENPHPSWITTVSRERIAEFAADGTLQRLSPAERMYFDDARREGTWSR